MPRFYFHLRTGGMIRDEVGEELPNMAAARRKARLSALEIARALDDPESAIVVTDGKHTLFEIAITERMAC